MPWSSVEYVQWGVATDRIVASKLAELAGLAENDDGEESPLDLMLRGMREARLAREGDGEAAPAPKPALSEEEIAAALEEDEKGLL